VKILSQSIEKEEKNDIIHHRQDPKCSTLLMAVAKKACRKSNELEKIRTNFRQFHITADDNTKPMYVTLRHLSLLFKK